MRDALEADAVGHRERQFADHLARVAGADRGSEDAVAALPKVNLDQPFRLPVEQRAVDVLELLNDRVDFQTFIARVFFIEPDMGDLWIGVRAPRDREAAQALSAEKERVLD